VNKLSKEDREMYLGVFHDVLLVDINRLQDKAGDPAMLDYQIDVLHKINPVKFAGRIKELKARREAEFKKWQRCQKKLQPLFEELTVYEKALKMFK
jgi:hypothetical protein